MMFPGLTLLLLGCIAIYLASPNQHCLTRPLPGRPTYIAAFLLMGTSIWFLSELFLTTTLVFVFVLWVMLALSLLPFIGALLSGISKDGADVKK